MKSAQRYRRRYLQQHALPERTAAAALRLSAHRRVLDLQGGGRRAMMLVGLAEHNQPHRQRARPCPIITSLAQNKLLHLQEAQLARLLSVSACDDSLAALPPPPPPPTTPPGISLPLSPSHPLCAQQRQSRVSPTKVTRAITIPEQTAGQEYSSTSLRAQYT